MYDDFTFNARLIALTSHAFSTTMSAMTELEHLEQKLAQLVALHKQVREENRDLRLRAMQLDADNKKLAEKVAAARERVEALLARVPAEG